jgi:phage terminase small subunit
MASLSENLTEKQKKFCEEWIFDFNASRAARDSGYSEDTAGAIGHENLKKPEIQAYIKELREDMEKASGISKLRVIREHEKLAFSSIAHLHNTWIERKEFDGLTDDQKACIQEISTQTRKEKGADDVEREIDYVKIKLYDKQKSLDAIGKILGFEAPAKIDHSSLGEKLGFVLHVKPEK